MKDKNNSKQFSRRSFIKGIGITTAGAAVLKGESLTKSLESTGILSKENIVPANGVQISLMINGKAHKLFIEPRTTLAEALRLNLNMTGTKIGCDRGACSACSVILNGKNVNSCMMLVIDCVGLTIETIEGLAEGDDLHPIQKSFIEHDAYQCGFCTSGMIISSKVLLDKNPNPSDLEIREAIAGNLCRCGSHLHIVEAVKSVSKG